MLADDLSVQIKLIVMYAIGVLALLTLLFFLYRKHQSFKNKYVATILGITIVMVLTLIDVSTLH